MRGSRRARQGAILARRNLVLIPLVTLTLFVGAERFATAQWGGYSSATTAGEGYARGFAEVVRSTGERNVMNAEAAKRAEEARAKNIENQLRYTEYYREAQRIKRETYRDEQEAKKSKTPTDQVYRAVERSVPKRMTTEELDPTTGEIHWPRVLTLDSYEDICHELEPAFAARAVKKECDSEEYLAIQQSLKALLKELKKHIREYPPQDYSTARSFAERLGNEARFAVE